MNRHYRGCYRFVSYLYLVCFIYSSTFLQPSPTFKYDDQYQRIYYRNNRIKNTSVYNRAPTTWEQLIQSKLKGQTRIEGLYKYMTLRSVNIILHIHIHLKVQNSFFNMSRWHESWSQDQFSKDCWFEQAANRQVGFGKQQKPAWMHQKMRSINLDIDFSFE